MSCCTGKWVSAMWKQKGAARLVQGSSRTLLAIFSWVRLTLRGLRGEGEGLPRNVTFPCKRPCWMKFLMLQTFLVKGWAVWPHCIYQSNKNYELYTNSLKYLSFQVWCLKTTTIVIAQSTYRLARCPNLP